MARVFAKSLPPDCLWYRHHKNLIISVPLNFCSVGSKTRSESFRQNISEWLHILLEKRRGNLVVNLSCMLFIVLKALLSRHPIHHPHHGTLGNLIAETFMGWCDGNDHVNWGSLKLPYTCTWLLAAHVQLIRIRRAAAEQKLLASRNTRHAIQLHCWVVLLARRWDKSTCQYPRFLWRA